MADTASVNPAPKFLTSPPVSCFPFVQDSPSPSQGSDAMSLGKRGNDGLEKGSCMEPVFEGGALTANPYYPVSEPKAAAEAKDAPPVASGLDSTPTNWFELAADLCNQGHITETRMRRAIEAVRKGVDRA